MKLLRRKLHCHCHHIILRPNSRSLSFHQASASQSGLTLDLSATQKTPTKPTYNTAFHRSISSRIPKSLSEHRLNDEPITSLAKSSLSNSRFSPINLNFAPICSSSRLLSPQTRLYNGLVFDAHLSNLSKHPKPTSRIMGCDPISGKFTQRRSFSSESSSPNSGIPNFSSPLESSAPIDAGSSIRKPISLWPGMYHSPVSNALWEARTSIFEKPNDDGSLLGELVAKPPSKSRTSILYKFSSDYILREQYRNPWNEVRMGKLVEDLDALAGTISYKHCCSDDGTTRPLLLVTASVDRIALKKPIHVLADLRIVGAVTWVGRSSMEIQLEVTQSIEGASGTSDSLSLVANFTFVARDSKTGKSALVNQISPETEKEKLLWEEAEERNKMRKKKREENRGKTENGDTERLNALLAEGRVFCDMPALADRNSILIKDTRHENSLICQPQQRNTHGRIFGGFLMRKAFEIAFSTAYAFAGAAPRFVEVDHVDFVRPVDVGNFLRLKSFVLYTELENAAKPLINVEVVAHVTSPELRSSEVSNKFYFTFTVRPEAIKDGLRIRNVVPATEEEARRVLERMDAESCQVPKS
ncbi:hypothetical protein Tsubulata_019757 [Turnera subulata]|uniref:HotDog ACOT-type domain-containing protein n=1 Tax=Turnera subulata TaxID=218843 RepID=A0A9Q0F2X2_9ROSI|nr:hypothetical protein Tsubulata_019757 [Turnera subulata]